MLKRKSTVFKLDAFKLVLSFEFYKKIKTTQPKTLLLISKMFA
jgi:hypothetical protein